MEKNDIYELSQLLGNQNNIERYTTKKIYTKITQYSK